MTNQDRTEALWTLLHERFPAFCVKYSRRHLAENLLELPTDKNYWTEETRAAQTYLSEINALTNDELRSRAAEQEILRHEKEAQNYERRHPINWAQFLANDVVYDYWSKAAYWSIDEFCALLIERSPKALDTIVKRRELTYSRIWEKFEDLRELARKARTMGQLYDTNIPGFAIAWAKRNRIDVPVGLENAVQNHGGQIADWKAYYDNAIAELNIVANELAELKSGGAPVATKAAKPFGGRERESLLKLVIGMAIKGYTYDPKAGRSVTPREIASDLEQLGLSLDEDTIRKYLNEAKELLPPVVSS